MLVLYPATLLNSFSGYDSYLVKILGFLIYKIMSFANTDNFISYSCLFIIVRTFRTVLNGGGKSRHPCLVSDFKRNVFNFFFCH